MSRVRGLAEWRPHAKTQALLDQVLQILADYWEHLPLTLRQVFYRLVATRNYDKTEQAYARLGETLNRARRAGIIEWQAIRDDGWQLHTPQSWGSPLDVARGYIQTLRSFRLDRQLGQPAHLLIAVEAAGMLPQVQRVADDFGIPCYAAGGFDSSTLKYELAEYLGQYDRAEVLHIGDHDPSGVHLFANLRDDVTAFANSNGGGHAIAFSRLAVTPDQIDAYSLPTAPAKPTDRRSFTGETVQAEALPPSCSPRSSRQRSMSGWIARPMPPSWRKSGRCKPCRRLPRRGWCARLAGDRATYHNARCAAFSCRSPIEMSPASPIEMSLGSCHPSRLGDLAGRSGRSMVRV